MPSGPEPPETQAESGFPIRRSRAIEPGLAVYAQQPMGFVWIFARGIAPAAGSAARPAVAGKPAPAAGLRNSSHRRAATVYRNPMEIMVLDEWHSACSTIPGKAARSGQHQRMGNIIVEHMEFAAIAPHHRRERVRPDRGRPDIRRPRR
ncbi:MAG: hypothetical protein QHC65_18120 [Sphingomonas sp.]|nr:hypothetical protein [Sphingomonas sp.]MDX3886342.1 hypothetical protein [Sphingomonas sp.]